MLVRLKGLERLFPNEKDRIWNLTDGSRQFHIPSTKGLLMFKRTGKILLESPEPIEEFELDNIHVTFVDSSVFKKTKYWIEDELEEKS